MKTAIWWIRRDLRLTDNQALLEAMRAADLVVPVFILDPKLLRSHYVGEKRLAFLYAGLGSLKEQLELRGAQLIIRHSSPVQALRSIMAESGAEAIFAESDVSPYARQRDDWVADQLPLRLCGSPAIQPPGSVTKRNGEPYTIFTPYSRAWKTLPLPVPDQIPAAPERIAVHPSAKSGRIHSEQLPLAPLRRGPIPLAAGEREAFKRLQAFLDGPNAPIYQYSRDRDQPAIDATSQLSPYLRFGMLSARLAASRAHEAIHLAVDEEARKSAETWMNELIWRDFYLHILYHFPQVRKGNFRLQAIAWRNSPQDLKAWQQGRTGYPFVDAAMRQLVQSGWMHNRLRMIAASFLTKDLLIDWRHGEIFFMQHLVDGDPASNNGGWQWSAGTGTDAAPYFRIFNPISQSRKHDPEGTYIRKWLPELASVPSEFIHAPWEMPIETQERAKCRIGADYPEPIVDHGLAKERALNAYGKA
jgi:deoxyribodipyrimidine photo-lyase